MEIVEHDAAAQRYELADLVIVGLVQVSAGQLQFARREGIPRGADVVKINPAHLELDVTGIVALVEPAITGLVVIAV